MKVMTNGTLQSGKVKAQTARGLRIRNTGFLIAAALMVTMVCGEDAMAGCGRSKRRSSSGSFNSLNSPTAFNSPISSLASMNSLRRSPNPAALFLAEQYRNQVARQQQQYRMRFQQQLALQQRLQRQVAAKRLEATSKSVLASSDSNAHARRDQLRQDNADKAFALATKAQKNKRYATAEKNYKRVLRILGDDQQLSREAKSALEGLAQLRGSVGQTLLASTTQSPANDIE